MGMEVAVSYESAQPSAVDEFAALRAKAGIE
jgi:hypothetical protein